MRVTPLVTLLASWLAFAGVARADVVGGPPDACPAGGIPSSCHGGPYCRLEPCTLSSECTGSAQCRELELCIGSIQCGGLIDPSVDANTYLRETVEGACAGGSGCSAGTCERVMVCAEVDGGGTGGSGGQPATGGSGGTPSTGGTPSATGGTPSATGGTPGSSGAAALGATGGAAGTSGTTPPASGAAAASGPTGGDAKASSGSSSGCSCAIGHRAPWPRGVVLLSLLPAAALHRVRRHRAREEARRRAQRRASLDASGRAFARNGSRARAGAVTRRTA